jgi:hypothetical protein
LCLLQHDDDERATSMRRDSAVMLSTFLGAYRFGVPEPHAPLRMRAFGRSVGEKKRRSRSSTGVIRTTRESITTGRNTRSSTHRRRLCE